MDRIPSTGTSVEALLGTCVHKAFEEVYLARLHGRVLSEDEALAVYEKEWAAGIQGQVAFRDARYAPEDWRRTGVECVTTYYRAHAPFDAEKTVAVEKRVGFPLPVPDPATGAIEEYRIEGFVDRLALAPDGCFEVHDYKTGGSLPTQAQKDADWQLAIYDIAVREAWPDAPGVRLVWHYVRHGRAIVSTRTAGQLAALKLEIAALIRTIRADRAFEPRKSPLCDWCDYREACPLFKHLEAYAKLPADERRHEGGVALADAFAELEARKKALRAEVHAIEAEEERLKAEIVAYAQARDVRALAGSDCEVEVHSRDDLKFPTRTAAADKVALMEEELRETPVWPLVSRVDPKLVVEVQQSGSLSADLARLLKSWLDRWSRRETLWTVRVKRRREAADE
ncbi:MAG: PD-(D/E)XK nuclease family protein [Elusimicrobia bacterium]|nr:PD-(D/E)XK nuclease family protein [Elusimicrobiota bacterium]